MALHLRSAGWAVPNPADRDRVRRPAALLLAAGAVSLFAGAAILIASLAPLFGLGTAAAALASFAAAPVASFLEPQTDQALPVSNSASARPRSAVATDGPVNGVAFEMRIPSLGYSATVLEGVGKNILDRSPGHYPESAWPGQPGNVGVAAHNVYWLSFSRLKVGDRVEIRTRRGLYVYEITGSKVVSPDDRTVLAQTPDHRLTLTTCYPLWAGAFATKRLVFSAREIGGLS